SEARSRQAKGFESRARLTADIARLSESAALAEQEIARLDQTLAESRAGLVDLNDTSIAAAQDRTTRAREDLLQTREALREVTRAFDQARAAQSTRQARLQAIGDERVNARNRDIRARERLKILDDRAASFAEKAASLEGRPDALKAERGNLLNAVSEGETERQEAADALACAESALAHTTRALKGAESDLSARREDRAREQATVAALSQRL
ncbi:MAG TPA: hypothetical protein PKX87_08745, partial [Alphaproteobacteria bacterium]|nr:hypothetical protein [Alphaproteobacteria bacterium]